jgi:hypothetical protein
MPKKLLLSEFSAKIGHLEPAFFLPSPERKEI